jgi:hypothetical protein
MALLDRLKRFTLDGIRRLGYDVTRRTDAPVPAVSLEIELTIVPL